MDAIDYVAGARAIAAGDIWGGVERTHPSIYPFLVVLIHLFTEDWIAAARVLPIVFGILTIIPFYLFTRELLGRTMGWLPVAMYITSPTIVRYSVDVVREPLFWFLMALFLWFLVYAHRLNHLRHSLIAGITALVGIAVRPDGLLLLLTGLAFILCARPQSPEKTRRILHASVFFFPALIVLISGFILIYSVAPDKGPSDLRIYQKQIKTSILGAAKLEDKVDKMITETRGYRLRRFLRMAWEGRREVLAFNLLAHCIKTVWPLYFVLMLMGFAKKEIWHNVKWWIPAIVIGLWVIMGYVRISGAFAISKRHLVPLAMCGYLYGAAGLIWAVDRISDRWPVVSKKTVSILLSLALLGTTFLFSLKPVRPEKIPRRMAGEWIRTHGFTHPVIVTDYPRIAFYSGGRAVSVRAFLENPFKEAQLLVLGWKKGRPPEGRILKQIRSLGMIPTPIRSFQKDEVEVTVYALDPLSEEENSKTPQ
jgi:4-amino-4-deoxy-L-arabinose transferase-like glycosyltransferase